MPNEALLRSVLKRSADDELAWALRACPTAAPPPPQEDGVEEITNAMEELWINNSTRSRSSKPDAVVATIQDALDRISKHPNGVRPSLPQRQTHRAMLASLLPYIYGDEWEFRRADVNSRLGYTLNTAFVAFVAARSDGKTVAASMFLAAALYALCERCVTVGVFAMVQTQTTLFLERTRDYLCLLPGGEEMFEFSTKQMRVYPRGTSHSSQTFAVMYAKSQNADAARGLQPNITVADEAGFIPNRTYFGALLPMVNADRRVWWTVTSPTDNPGVFKTLVTRTLRNGDPLCAVIRSQTVCSECAAEGLKTCGHVLKMQLSHKTDPFKREAMAILYEHSAADRARELGGLIDMTTRNCFDRDAVDRALRHQVTIRNPIPFIFVGVDPSGGGSSSETAWVVATFQDDSYVVRLFIAFSRSHGAAAPSRHSRRPACMS
jgi:hypothetical protein